MYKWGQGSTAEQHSVGFSSGQINILQSVRQLFSCGKGPVSFTLPLDGCHGGVGVMSGRTRLSVLRCVLLYEHGGFTFMHYIPGVEKMLFFNT